jgi:nitronate monooxygenase
MRKSRFSERFTQQLGIEHPVIQGPFGGGLSTLQLTSIVSNGGGLGSYGAHNLEPERIAPLIDELRHHTRKPFAVNLWISDHDPGGLHITQEEFDRIFLLFEPIFNELDVSKPALPERFHHSYERQVDALLEAGPPVFSFVFGIPSKAVIAECRRKNIVTIGTATSIREALAIEAAGIDMMVATGFEAGGHRPSFLAAAEDSLMGTFALTQLVRRRVSIPVIAAGGIADGRAVRSIQMLGADAAQIGSAFLACAESGTTDDHRAALLGDAGMNTTLTRSFTGRLARGIRNRWTESFDTHRDRLPPFPIQSWLMSQLRPAAIKAGRTDVVSLWSSQIAPNLTHRSATSLMQSIITDLAAEPALDTTDQ